MRDPPWSGSGAGCFGAGDTPASTGFFLAAARTSRLGYAAFRAGSFHAAKVDAELSRDPSRHWRCFHPRFRFL